MNSIKENPSIKHHVNKRGNLAVDKVKEATQAIRRNAELALCGALLISGVALTSCSTDSPEVTNAKFKVKELKLQEEKADLNVDRAEDYVDAVKDVERTEAKKEEIEEDLKNAEKKKAKLDKIVNADDRTEEQKSLDRIK